MTVPRADGTGRGAGRPSRLLLPVWVFVAVVAAVVAAVAALVAAPRASAFDTGTHFDITRDALSVEGFNSRAIQSAQVSNWLVDLYENAEKTPFSGHAGFFVDIIGGASPLSGFWKWPDEVVEAADRSHFDGTAGGFANTALVMAEWERLRRSVAALAVEARERNDPEQLLSILGISLHQVQDFYTHSNWLEPGGVPDGVGPDWAGQGFGATATWFDIPPAVREAERIHVGGSTGVVRDHGSWKADGNASLTRSNAKDWPGRPLYTEAHLAAYFASRQWVRAIRARVADEAGAEVIVGGVSARVRGGATRGSASVAEAGLASAGAAVDASDASAEATVAVAPVSKVAVSAGTEGASVRAPGVTLAVPPLLP
jgi:hypothetical protein